MFIKKGISFTPEQVKMKMFESGDGQQCARCGEKLDPSRSVNGIIPCNCGQPNEIDLEQPNGK